MCQPFQAVENSTEGQTQQTGSSHQQQVGDITVSHALRAAERGVSCHMNACLLTPLHHSVIFEVAVDFHLQYTAQHHEASQAKKTHTLLGIV